ncbi:unnamed protein product [Cyclocybe aegerita]|uniref:Uncharacterized protein n=1 Tax=Cyclocybe aegerita TaxID=1973307 RepID=A0A8S0W5W7_CYCAE|nr:unnamed protein product [Cyclocybe aegerita]
MATDNLQPQQQVSYSQRRRADDQVGPLAPRKFTDAHEPGFEEREYIRGRFGKKHDDLVRKYGAYKVIYDDEGNPVDLAEPIEYLEEIDNRILHAVATGNTGELEGLVPTSSALLQLARGETSFVASMAKQLRSDPGVLRDVIREDAYIRSETIPDENGNAPNVETDMLTNASYLAQEVRYIIHNTLLQLGQWHLASDYLKELVEHDETYGREERIVQRQELMNSVRFVVEQGIEIVSKMAGQAIRKHPKFAKLWVRLVNFEPKWTGARIEVKSDPDSQAEIDAFVQSRTLHGALFRITLKWSQLEQYSLIKDLCERFAKTDQSELDELGEPIVESVSQLKSVFDFYLLLGIRQPEDQFPADKRLRHFKENSETAQGILNNAALERHIKGLDSLASEATLKKIWSEIDKLSLKKSRQTVEELIGYEKPASRWYTRILPRRPAPSSSSQPTQQLRQPREPKVHQIHPTVEHEPVKLTPVSDVPSAKNPEPEEPVTRTKPKVKTVGVPHEQPEVPLEEEKVEETLTGAGKVLFYVKKHYYNIVEKIFKPGAVKGQLDQDDFMKLMGHLNFSKKPGSGSRVTMEHASPSNQPFIFKFQNMFLPPAVFESTRLL